MLLQTSNTNGLSISVRSNDDYSKVNTPEIPTAQAVLLFDSFEPNGEEKQWYKSKVSLLYGQL